MMSKIYAALAAVLMLLTIASPVLADMPPAPPVATVSISGNALASTENANYGFALTANTPSDSIDHVLPVTVTAVYTNTAGTFTNTTVMVSNILIPANSVSGTSNPSFPIPDDLISGMGGSMTVTLTSSSGIILPDPFTVTVADGTGVPALSITGTDPLAEGNTATYTVHLSVPCTTDTAVGIAMVDNGPAGSSSLISTTGVTIPAYATTATFSLHVGKHDDGVVSSRSIVLTASSASAITGTKTVTITDAETSYTLTVNQGWNLLSLSVVPTNDVWNQIVSNSGTFSVWQYTGGAYQYKCTRIGYTPGTLTSLTQGLGFWVYATAGYTVNVVYDPTAPLSVTTPVHGWNLVACPLANAGHSPTDLMTDTTQVVYAYIGSSYQYYAGSTSGYTTGSLSTLNPWYGYWVYVP